MRKPRFGSPKRRNFDSEINKKMTWKQARTKKHDILRFLNSKSEYTQVPKSPQNRIKSCKWPSRVHPAAPTSVVLRCQNGPPGCSRGAKNFARNAKVEAPKPTNGKWRLRGDKTWHAILEFRIELFSCEYRLLELENLKILKYHHVESILMLPRFPGWSWGVK